MSKFKDCNKRIAQNTILLYLRQLIIMLVALYTSRIILRTLGITDYGIYNVVAGIVTMLSFLMTTMGAASQRYLSYDLAKGNKNELKETFGIILFSYLLLAFISVILIEGLAVWFLNTNMTIPQDRIYAANWVLQFSILTFLIHIFATPYLSVIISREKMGVYAYISITDVVLKLVNSYLIIYSPIDKLVFFSILSCLSSVVITLSYQIYCILNFPESRSRLLYNKQRLSEMCSFIGWNMLGTLANLFRSQGINILLNVFFNPIVNAARGIAYQVNSAVTSFSHNFYMAVRPQIVKNCANGDMNRMHDLIYNSSRFAFFLLMLITMPVFFYTELLLRIWLDDFPSHTTIFVQLILINSLLEVYSLPLVNGLQAVGKIKHYQIVVSGLYLLNLPVSYVFLKLDYPPEITLIINLILLIIGFIPRLLICKKYYGISLKEYFEKVLLRTLGVLAICSILCIIIKKCFIYSESIISLCFSIISMIFIQLLVVFFFGITMDEKIQILKILRKKVIGYGI